MQVWLNFNYITQVIVSYHSNNHSLITWCFFFFFSFSQRKFKSAPTVLVSAEHARRGVKHDASSVWVEDLTTTSFKICIRELQNFDGIHYNFTIKYMYVFVLIVRVMKRYVVIRQFSILFIRLRYNMRI